MADSSEPAPLTGQPDVPPATEEKGSAASVQPSEAPSPPSAAAEGAAAEQGSAERGSATEPAEEPQPPAAAAAAAAGDATKADLLKSIFGDSDDEAPETFQPAADDELLLDDDDGEQENRKRLQNLAKKKKKEKRKHSDDEKEGEEKSEERSDGGESKKKKKKKRKDKQEKEGKRKDKKKKDKKKKESSSTRSSRKRRGSAAADSAFVEPAAVAAGEGGEPAVAAEGTALDEASDEQRPSSSRGRAPKVKSDFDLVLESLKAGHRRPSKKKDESEEAENVRQVQDVISRMQTACQDDIDAYERQQPATAKLRYLPEATVQLRRKPLQEMFVNGDVLTVIAQWLQPFKDGTLPNLTIRENLLQLLLELPGIDAPRLKASGVGKAVFYLSKAPGEVAKNKKLAQELIEKWSRPLFQLSDKYNGVSWDEREQAIQARAAARLRSSGGDRRESDPLDKVLKDKRAAMQLYRAAIPQRDALDFIHKPKPAVAPAAVAEYDDEEGFDEQRPAALPPQHPSHAKIASKTPTGARFEARFKQLGKTLSSNNRAEKPSIEGRGLHL